MEISSSENLEIAPPAWDSISFPSGSGVFRNQGGPSEPLSWHEKILHGGNPIPALESTTRSRKDRNGRLRL